MISITINGKQIFVPRGASVLEACKQIGVDIPRFCYHENLSVAGNCRMCLVEIEKSPKPVASCAMPVSNNMVIFTDTPLIKKARENVLETLLLNHPLDCPICDQAGECDLQDQTRIYGGDYSRFYTLKRTVEDKNIGPLIKTIMTRCIHCTRCVRFASEIAGIDTLGTLNRGVSTEIGTYIDKLFQTEISGNVVDLCPVGALTSKPYAFVSRPWELRRVSSIDPLDSTGSNIWVEYKETEIVRILPRFSSGINLEWISDKIRYTFDSLRRFRITKIYEKVNQTYKPSSWDAFFNFVKGVLAVKKSLVLVQPNADVKTIFFLRALNYLLNTRVRIIGPTLSQSDILNKTFPFVELQKTDSCFLVGANIKIENPILQIRLRERFLKGNFLLCSSGAPFSNTISTRFLNLTPLFLLKIFYGKSSLQQFISCCKKPSFFFGKTVIRRMPIKSILNSLKKISPNCLYFYSDISPNMKLFELFNLFSVTRSDYDWSDVIFFLNTEDSFLTRSLLTNNCKKQKIWANTHGSSLAENSDVIIPITTFFEDVYHFINAEGRLQNTQTSVSGTQEMLSLWKLSKLLNNRSVEEKNFKNLVLPYQEPQVFCHSKFSNCFVSHFTNKKVITGYPLKSNIEDFHLTNGMTRASGIMGKCSQAFRNCQTNFVKLL